MVIYIGSDHAGFDMKSSIITMLGSHHEIIDLGTSSTQSCDYPDFAKKVADAVIAKPGSIGVLVCGTGFGMAIAANKVDGIRAVNVVMPNMASLACEHNNANVLCLSARFVRLEDNIEIISNFLKAKYDPRHNKRLEKIKKIEESNKTK